MDKGLYEQMHEKHYNLGTITEALKSLFYDRVEPRKITLHTGEGGFDLLLVWQENKGGYYRSYIGKKPMRLLKNLYPMRKDYRGWYYRLLKTKDNV